MDMGEKLVGSCKREGGISHNLRNLLHYDLFKTLCFKISLRL